jgi:hypothetical protein
MMLWHCSSQYLQETTSLNTAEIVNCEVPLSEMQFIGIPFYAVWLFAPVVHKFTGMLSGLRQDEAHPT